MENKKTFLTAEGLKKLEQELNYLLTEKRQEVAERLNEAIKLGDLSENSEYESAKDEQAFVAGRIMELEHMIKTAVIIESGDSNVVNLGSTVVLKDLETGEVETYTIVGTTEADPFENRISNDSPVGKAILGKEANSIVVANTPAGELQYQIMSIE